MPAVVYFFNKMASLGKNVYFFLAGKRDHTGYILMIIYSSLYRLRRIFCWIVEINRVLPSLNDKKNVISIICFYYSGVGKEKFSN